MEGFLRVDHNAGISSPSSSFNPDNADSTSICPLITPSPPTNALVDPVPESNEPNYQIGAQLAEKLQMVHGNSNPPYLHKSLILCFARKMRWRLNFFSVFF